MERAYVDIYRELYERHWWWRARESVLLAVLRGLRDGRGPARILDVGCGDALFFERLAEFGDVRGIEVDEALVEKSNRYRDRIHLGPFDGDFAKGERFDLVLMLDVLEHIPEPVPALENVARLLTDDGRALITVPAFKLLWTRHDELNRHRTRYTNAALRKEAGQSGLEIVHSRYLFHWLFPLKLFVRAGERLRKSEPRPPRVPGRALNRLALELSLLEWRLIGPLRLPFGSSLLAVLAKPK